MSIYLDHNATTPLRPEVLEAMLPYLGRCNANPSSIHSSGQRARLAVERAQAEVAKMLCCAAEEVYFTSGGTEANNWAIKGVVAATGKRRIITSSIEHPAVRESCEYLRGRGFEVIYVPVSRSGIVDPAAVAAVIDHDTALVSIMHANNETGSLQPIAAIGEVARAWDVPLHVDAVQSFAKVPFSVDEWNADLVSLSAHKLNGPTGVGVLYSRNGTALHACIHGGGQQGQLRAGTENVSGIVGFGEALVRWQCEGMELDRQLRFLRDRLQEGLCQRLDNVVVNGHARHRLGNTLNICFHGIEAESIVLGLDMEGVAVGSGSACSSGNSEPSHVLLAMGLEPRLAAGGVRFSFGWGNTVTEVDYVLEVLPGIVGRLREISVF